LTELGKLASCFAALGMLVVACAGDPEAGAVDPCPNAERRTIPESELTLERSANLTEFSVTFVSLRCTKPPSTLIFRVSMTNHAGVPGWANDLLPHAKVRAGGVEIVEGLAWENLSSDDHHPAGTLSTSASHDGVSLIGCNTDAVTLEISGIDMAEGEHLTFTWADDVRDALRSCP
jgi:hypothetical protein